jgi:hypothetical protein
VIDVNKVKTAKSSIHTGHIVLLSISTLFLAGVLLLNTAKNSEAVPDNFQSNNEVAKKMCDTVGAPVINITQKILNTVDSGEGGNNWAFDDLNRQIKVYKQSNNSYCVLMDNEGKFDSQAGQQSPGNTNLLTGKEDGTFKGGYRATIVGSPKENPELSTKGSIGTVDYDCDLSGNCPGYFNWADKYFSPGYIFSYEWWGWKYKYKNYSWINSSDGNSGDII